MDRSPIMLAMLWESGCRAAPSSMPLQSPTDQVGDPRREFHPCQMYLIIQSLYLLGQCSVQSLSLSLPPVPRSSPATSMLVPPNPGA